MDGSLRGTLVYIAGPYRASSEWGVHKNIHRAALVAYRYWEKGYTVICPHLNSMHFGGLLSDGVWLAGDLQILYRCDGIVMMENWELSRGAVLEHTKALEWGKFVIYDNERG